MSRKKLFLLDGSAVYFRAHYAFYRNPLINSKGEELSALYGFANTVFKLIKDENPDQFIICFDLKGKTLRHGIFPEYKANRGEMPEELQKQVPLIHEFVELSGIPCSSKEGIEADDILGTLAFQGVEKGYDVFIITGDKDLCQVVNEHIFIYNIRSLSNRKEVKILDSKAVKEKFGVEPKFITDFLALTGDSSDNIPGVKGIGPKGAKNLIQKFGALDNIYEKLSIIEPKGTRTKLETSKEEAFLSKKLVTLIRDISLGEGHDVERPWSPRSKELKDFLTELELPSLVSQVPEKILGDISAFDEVQVIKNEKSIKIISLENLNQLKPFVSSETMCFLLIHEGTVYISFSETMFYSGVKDNLKLVQEAFSYIDDKDKVNVICFDLKQIYHSLSMSRSFRFYDFQLAYYLLKPELKDYDVFSVSKSLGLKLDSGGVGSSDEEMSRIMLNFLEHSKGLIKDIEGHSLEELLFNVELPLCWVLYRMEQRGILLNKEELVSFSEELMKEKNILEKAIFEESGENFNLLSPQQLGHVLFESLRIQDRLGIKKLKKTKTGYSTSSQTLQLFIEEPIVEKVLRYRLLSKLQNTYVESLLKLRVEGTGRIYTSFNQRGTVTGRLSSTSPNLQNIPIRSKDGVRIRKAFIAKIGKKLLSADYSQIELRLLAHFSKDPMLLKDFNEGGDVHKRTASRLFKVPFEEVDSDMRRKAKAVNFGVIYGMGAFRLSQEMGMKVHEASSFIENYFFLYEGVRSYIHEMIENAKMTEETRTFMGRLRRIPEINSSKKLLVSNAENIAVNTPIQGAAADLIKLAMVRIEEKLSHLFPASSLLIQVHDELLFEVEQENLQEVKSLVVHEMENVIKLEVPLIVNVGEGDNWYDAHP